MDRGISTSKKTTTAIVQEVPVQLKAKKAFGIPDTPLFG
jgi:hypothetical protein